MPAFLSGDKGNAELMSFLNSRTVVSKYFQLIQSNQLSANSIPSHLESVVPVSP